MTGQPRDRIVTGNISLSLDGRVTGPAGEHDMGWIVPHALTDESRAHLLRIISAASTVLLGRKNYQGFAGFWPAVAGDDDADPRDRAFARWLNEAEKVVVSRTLTEASWPGSRVVADDPAQVVRRLRQEEGGDIVVLASSIVNVALPTIQADLGFSQAGLAWVVNAYLIAFAGLLLLAGRLGDLAGRRDVFLAGLAIFTVASMACGLAVNQEMLIVARFLQGTGGALTSAVILGMIVTMFPGPREH